MAKASKQQKNIKSTTRRVSFGLARMGLIATCVLGVNLPSIGQGVPSNSQCYTTSAGQYVCPDGQYPRYRQPRQDAPTVGGYRCTTSDCAGHEAGYNWARNKGITNPDSCTGKSQSFVEGCRAFAEGN